jgi:hypothetical protein
MSWVSAAWGFYKENQGSLTPLLAPLGTILVGLGTFAVGIGTMGVSRQQARTATQQVVTTAFHNAVSRLASDKTEERLGGIYILERVARDSLIDHWPVMETLTAFVRARATWQERAAPAMAQPVVRRSRQGQQFSALVDLETGYENRALPELLAKVLVAHPTPTRRRSGLNRDRAPVGSRTQA